MLDVRDILNDPDMSSDFIIKREAGTFGPTGVYSTTPQDITAHGVVMPSKDADVVRFLPEGERQTDYVTVYSPVEIQLGANGAAADVIVWNGRTYTAMFRKDYSQMGGYWFAMAQGKGGA